MGSTVVLGVGEDRHLKSGKDRIIYAGMPSENIYSKVQRKREFPYEGYAWNLFYPKSRTSLTIDGVNITIESVAPDEIRLRIG